MTWDAVLYIQIVKKNPADDISFATSKGLLKPAMMKSSISFTSG